jgi:hypothetical protein
VALAELRQRVAWRAERLHRQEGALLESAPHHAHKQLGVPRILPTGQQSLLLPKTNISFSFLRK